jgi:hypothetical protein
LGTLGRSIFAQPERGFLGIAAFASHSVAVPPACFALLVWKASGDRKSGTIRSGRSSRSNRLTRACHEGRRHTERSPRNANAHRFDPALEKEGRAVLRGRPLRGRHSKNTDLFGRPSDRPSQFHAPPSGARRFRGWRQRFGARVCPRWALTAGGCYRLAPLRCLSARYTRPRKNARDPLRPSPPTAPPLAVRSDPSQAIRNCLAGHA